MNHILGSMYDMRNYQVKRVRHYKLLSG